MQLDSVLDSISSQAKTAEDPSKTSRQAMADWIARDLKSFWALHMWPRERKTEENKDYKDRSDASSWIDLWLLTSCDLSCFCLSSLNCSDEPPVSWRCLITRWTRIFLRTFSNYQNQPSMFGSSKPKASICWKHLKTCYQTRTVAVCGFKCQMSYNIVLAADAFKLVAQYVLQSKPKR